jgi:ankyrin repeat protein
MVLLSMAAAQACDSRHGLHNSSTLCAIKSLPWTFTSRGQPLSTKNTSSESRQHIINKASAQPVACCCADASLPLQDAVKMLLAHNANVKLSAQDDMNALHFAAQKGHAEVIRLLVTAGAVTSCFHALVPAASRCYQSIKADRQCCRHTSPTAVSTAYRIPHSTPAAVAQRVIRLLVTAGAIAGVRDKVPGITVQVWVRRSQPRR